MASVNRIMLLGTVTKKPDYSFLPSGTKVVSLVLRTGEGTNEEFHQLRFYGTQADIAEKELAVSSIIFIDGRIRYERFTDKSGNKQNRTTINVRDLQIIRGKGTKKTQPQPDLLSASNNYARMKDGLDPVQKAPDLNLWSGDNFEW